MNEITALIQQGESLAYVRDQLGHKSIQITSMSTVTWCPAAIARRVDRLDDTQLTAPPAQPDHARFRIAPERNQPTGADRSPAPAHPGAAAYTPAMGHRCWGLLLVLCALPV